MPPISLMLNVDYPSKAYSTIMSTSAVPPVKPPEVEASVTPIAAAEDVTVSA